MKEKVADLILKTIFLLMFVALVLVTVATHTRSTESSNEHGKEEIKVEKQNHNISIMLHQNQNFSEEQSYTASIELKSDHFVDLNIDAVWLSPIFTSPMKDFGYDISNFRDIQDEFGTMTDMEDLISTLHSKGIKIILDFVPNHTSNEHEWFKKSVNRDEKYEDYYVWKDPSSYDKNGPIVPNNWLSVFRNSAWQWSEQRQQFYLHQFLKEQPDLNYRNTEVRQEMENVLKFWLDKGIDGFRLDALKFLVEDDNVYEAMEPVSNKSKIADPTQYDYLDHIYTINMPETFDVIGQWRQILDQYPNRFLMGEVCDDLENVMKYYGSFENPLVDFPFNFELITTFRDRRDVTGTSLKSTIESWMNNMPRGMCANWVLGSHDHPRIASRLGNELVDAMNMIALLLPGTSITYQGEEIGFTRNNSAWLPVNDNYLLKNVKLQKEIEQSNLNVYKQLTKLRKELSFRKGSLSFPLINKDIFSFMRTYENATSYVVVINTSIKEKEVSLENDLGSIPVTATIILRSSFDNRMETKPGNQIDLSSFILMNGEGLVLELLA